MRKLFLLLLGATISALSAEGASIWINTTSEVDERVADTQTLAPIDLMKPAFAKMPFTNFRYPHVDPEQNVTFIADDPVYNGKGTHHGIYRSVAKTGELIALMREGEPVPGTADARFEWFRGLQVDGDDFVINAIDTGHERGLYHFSNGRVTVIARTHLTIIPGVDHALTGIEYGSLKDGRILYSAKAAGESLLILHDLRTQKARVLCRTGDAIPAQPREQFRYFATINWVDGANVVFRGASVDNPHNVANDPTGHYGIYGWFGIDWKNPQALDLSHLVSRADATVQVPLLASGARFNDFRSAPVRDGLIPFTGSGGGKGARFNGVYYCDMKEPSGSIHPIVDTESGLQGLFAGNFHDFGIYCTCFENSVVFTGYAADHFVGVFLYRTDRDELFLLTDNRQPLEGKKIHEFEIAGDFLVGNRFAVTATFDDGSSGVYLATIPKESFRRMAAVAK